MNFNNFNLANPESFVLIFVLGLFLLFANFKRKKEKFLTSKILPKILENVQRKENKLYKLSSLVLITSSLALLTIALARPQWGYEVIPGSHIGLDIAIAVDVSESMLAEDTKPDRLSFTRRKVEDFINLIQGDRIGLISFAGASFIESPLTLDYNSIKLLARNLSVDLVPLKGSNLESAVLSSVKIFKKSTENNSNRAKVMLIISDGEFEDIYLKPAIQLLKDNNILPFLIIVGAEEGAPIPSGNGFRRDQNNKIIISKANLEILSNEFNSIDGMAVRATLTENDIKEIYLNKIKKNLTQSKFTYNNVKKWNEYFQIPLLLGLIIISIAWRTPNKFFLFFLIQAYFFTSTSYAQSNSEIINAQKLYEEGKFKEALNILENSNNTISNAFEKNILLGNTYYRLKDYKKALEEFGKAQSVAEDSKNRSKALFNTANTLIQSGQLDKSLEILEQAKKETPKDKEIDNNISYVKKLLKNLDKPKEDKPKEDKEEEQKDQENEEQEKDTPEDKKDSKENKSKDQENNKEKGEKQDQAEKEQDPNKQ
jgi:Ca-activated chloride channel family protein